MLATKNHPSTQALADLEAEASRLIGRVYLRCDGYLVSAGWARHSKSGQSFRLVPYVNGYLRGKWMQVVRDAAELPEESRRFWRLTTLRLYPPAKIKELEKGFGKRFCKKHGVYDMFYVPMPDFITAGAFLRHIRKHNQTIEILTKEQYRAAINALPPEEDV